MESFFSPHYAGLPFELFGAKHLWAILFLVLAGIWIVRAGIAGDESLRRSLRWWMVAMLVFWQIEWHVWHLVTGLWTIQVQLPLHMCGIMIWVTVYSFVTGDRRLYPLIYFFGIAGSLQAVLTPEAAFDFPHLRFLNTMISHGQLVIAGFWVVFVERFRPTRRDVVASLAVLNVYALFVYAINVSIGANYLYVVNKPATVSLLDYFPDWPWYILILEVLVAVILTLMYWPFRLNDAAETMH